MDHKRKRDHKEGADSRDKLCFYANRWWEECGRPFSMNEQEKPFYREPVEFHPMHIEVFNNSQPATTSLIEIPSHVTFIAMFRRLGAYLKIPPHLIKTPEVYMQKLKDRHYHILVVDDGKSAKDKLLSPADWRCSSPFPMDVILNWPHHMEDPDGENKNRMTFNVPFSTIDCRGWNQQTINGTFLEEFEQLTRHENK